MSICFHWISFPDKQVKIFSQLFTYPSSTIKVSLNIHFGKTVWKYFRTRDTAFSFCYSKAYSLEKLSFISVQISPQVTRNQTAFSSASRSSWMPPTAGTQGNTNYIPAAWRVVLLWDCSNYHPMVMIADFTAGKAGYEKIILPSSFLPNRSQVTQKWATFQEWTGICSPVPCEGLA